MLRKSPGSIAVLIAFIVSDILISNGYISQDQRLIIPGVFAIAWGSWVTVYVLRKL